MNSEETNKERFLHLVDPNPSDTMAYIQYRVDNRYWLKVAKHLAMRILDRMDEIAWDEERLVKETELELEIIQEILAGERNLLFSELMKISDVLDIKITFSIK